MSKQVVLVTALPEVRTAVGRLAALAGADLTPIGPRDGLRGAWRAAAAVVIGTDLLEAVAAAGLPRRDRVVVVSLGPAGEAAWRACVTIGATRLAVLPGDDRDLIDLLTDDRAAAAAIGTALAVVGGCGGAGASTLAAAVALHSTRTTPTLLVDADPLGGGLDLLLGAERVPGLRWPDLADTRGRIDVAALTSALPDVAGCALVSHGRGAPVLMSADATAALLDAGIRGFGRVIVDLSRTPSPAAEAIAAGCDRVVLLVPATVRATAAASVVWRSWLSGLGERARLVVRDPGGERLSVADVSRALELPAVATFSSEATVAAAADRGEPPRRSRGSLAAACQAILAEPGGAT